MKRRFTKLMAALALLLFLTPSMVGWGQERATFTGTFTKITSADDFETGFYVVVGLSSANRYALGSTVNSSKRIEGVSITPDGNTISNPSDALVYYITKSNNTCTFKNINTGKYMYQASTTSGKGMGFSDNSYNITYNGYNSTTNNIGHKFTLNGTSNNIFKYNTGNKWFANYTGAYQSDMLPVELYKCPAYTIIYDKNHNDATGTVTDSNNPYASGSIVTVQANGFTNNGYNFMGWNTAADGSGTSYDEGDEFTITANTTLYAQWQPAGNYIIVSPTIANVDEGGEDIEFSVSTDQTLDDNPVVFYETSEGTTTTTTPDWITEINYLDGELVVTVAANSSVARTAYFKVENSTVQSDVVTISQAAITVATPVFDVAAGTYYEDQLVDITCATSGATIRYTTDGNTPTANSIEYDGNGVTITESTTLKAIAIKNSVSSEVATANYTIIHPLTTMDAIFEAATNNGSTASNVNVTFGNWVVSGVSGSNVFVTDNSGKGFIIYKNGHGFTIDDILSGTVMGTPLKLYNGSAEFTDLTSSTSGLFVSHDGEITIITDKAIADLGGVNTGAVITLNNLTYDGTNLSDGTNTIKPYNTLYSGMSFTTGKTYNVTGVYQQFGNTKEILPRSANDIEEVVAPTITLLPNSSIYVPVSAYQMEFTYSATDANRIDQVVYDHFDDALNAESFAIQFYDGDGNEDVTPDWFVSTPVVVLDENENKLYLSIAVGMNTVAAPRTAYFKVWAYNGSTKVYSELVTVNQAGYVPTIAVNPAEVAVPNGGGEGQLAVTYDPFTFSGNQSYNVWWCDADGNSVSHDDVYPWLTASFGETRNVLVWQVTTANESEEARTAYLKVEAYDDFIGMVYSNLVTITQAAPQISVTVTPTTVNFAATDPAGFQMENLTIAYENIEVTNYQSFTVQFYDNQGNETEASTYQWLVVGVTGSNDEGYVVRCVAGDNAGAARTASFKVYAYDADNNKVYSDLVTINQAKYDCANLPFSYDGNGQGNLPTGLTVHGTGTYNSSPKIQFNDKDSEGVEDYVILKINEEPGELKFDIKGNSFSGGTFRMQTSTDGITYTDKVSYTTMPTTAETRTISDLASDVRYIKWSYTKVSGNVAFGNIRLAKAPQKYDLAVNELADHISAIYVFNAADQTNPLIDEGIAGTTQVYEGTSIMVSPVVAEGYMLETLMINNDNVISQLDETGAYTFTMPDGNVTISATAVALPPALYSYSVNGVEDQPYDAFQGQTITLAYGQGLNQDFTFAGWTTDPSNVSERLSGGTEYELTEEVTVFYAVYAKTVMGVAEHEVILDGEASGLTSDAGAQTLSENGFTYYASSAKYQNLGSDAENNISTGRTILIGKEGANLHNTTTFGDGITKFEIYANKGAAQAATAGVYFSTSEITGYTTGDNTWESNSSGMGSDKLYDASSAIPSGAKYFWYQVTNDKNTQVQFRITYTATESITTYYTRVFLNETLTDDLEINGPSIIPSGSRLDMGSHSLGYAQGVSNLIIEDGGQLISHMGVQATMLKHITGTDFGSQANPTNAGYYLIASPLAMAPTAVNNMIVTTNGDYDLYAFDPTAVMEWQNYKSSNFTLALGKGYLYANSNTTTLEFAGQLNSGFVPTNLNYVAGDDLHSLNLVGNPFAHEYDFVVKQNSDAVDFNYLTLNPAGNGFITNYTEGNAAVTLDPMEAILVQAPGADYHFADPNAGDMSGIIDDGEIEGLLNISVSRNRGASVGSTAIIDNALVSFGNAPLMKKIRLSDNATELCMLQGGEEMAVVRAQGQGELPVSFKAAQNGSYTLSIETKNVKMNYLHLIDNKTGNDVDLLATPSYTFEAKTSDYASRFRLVFSANNTDEDGASTGSATFAYFNGSNWTVSNMGEATLQVVDVMGRVLSSETLSGNAEVSINQPTGVYMLRLVSGDSVKVQKVVVR